MRGYQKSDLRHLHLHKVAFEQLRAHSDLRGLCLALARRWQDDPAQASAHRWLAAWCDMLAEWPLERIAELVLDLERGQILRQCSPLGPALTPRQRWEALAEVNRLIDADATAANQ